MKTEEEIKALIPELKKQKKISDKELDIVCGWYFYSEAHIKRIIKSMMVKMRKLIRKTLWGDLAVFLTALMESFSVRVMML